MSWRPSNRGSSDRGSSDRGCSRDDSQDSRLSGSARSGCSKVEQEELRREKAELQDQIEHMQDTLDSVRRELEAVRKEQLDGPINGRRRHSKKRRGHGSSSSDDEKRTRTSKNLHDVVKNAVSKQRQRAQEELDLAKQKASFCIEEMDELHSELRAARIEQDSSKKRISDLERQRVMHQMEVQVAQEGMQTELRVSARLQDELHEIRKIREEKDRRHPNHFDQSHVGFPQHVGRHPPPDNTDANSLAAELENLYDSADEILDSPCEEIQHTHSGETMKLVQQLRAQLDEALKSKLAAETAASMARTEAAEKEEELRKSLAESTVSWGLQMPEASHSRRPSIAESISSISTSVTSSERSYTSSSRSTRESLGSDAGRLIRRDRRPRTYNAAASYNAIKHGVSVTRATSLTSDGPQVPTDPNELRESYMQLLEQSERLRAERDKAQQERQELIREQTKLEEQAEDSRRWTSWDSLKQTVQQGADMLILSAAGTMDLDPIQEDEPSGPQVVQPQARRAWSHDGSNTARTSTRVDLRKRITSQRNARSRDGQRSNAAYHNVRLMKKAVDVMDTPHIPEEGRGAAE